MTQRSEEMDQLFRAITEAARASYAVQQTFDVLTIAEVRKIGRLNAEDNLNTAAKRLLDVRDTIQRLGGHS